MTVLVDHLVVAEMRHGVLQHVEAPAVDGAHEHRTEPVEELAARQLFGPAVDPLLQFRAGLLGERERDDRARFHPFMEKARDPARDRLGFARSRARDDLQIAAPVRDDSFLIGGEVHYFAVDSKLSEIDKTSGNRTASVTLHLRLAPEGWKAHSTNYNSIDKKAIHAFDVSMKKIQILFPDPQMERLRLVARLEDRPISEIVRRATEDYLKKIALSPRPNAAATIPVFDGGDTLVGPERFRELSYADRVGMHE